MNRRCASLIVELVRTLRFVSFRNVLNFESLRPLRRFITFRNVHHAAQIRTLRCFINFRNVLSSETQGLLTDAISRCASVSSVWEEVLVKGYLGSQEYPL